MNSFEMGRKSAQITRTKMGEEAYRLHMKQLSKLAVKERAEQKLVIARINKLPKNIKISIG